MNDRVGKDKSSTGTILAVVAGLVLVVVILAGFFLVQFFRAQSAAETAMEDFCSTIEPGLSVEQVEALVAERADMQFTDLTSSVQIDRLDGEFLCICSADVGGGVITSPGSVFCVD